MAPSNCMGETVAQRWARLEPPERRLWLVGVGINWTFKQERQPHPERPGRGRDRWIAKSSFHDPEQVRERLARPAAYRA